MVAYDDTEQTTKVRSLFNTATLLNTRCDLALEHHAHRHDCMKAYVVGSSQ